MEPDKKIKLFIDKRAIGIVQPHGGFATQNHSDFFVTIQLEKENSILGDYVDIALDPNRTSIQRQNINPFFMEFGFFESIEKIGEDTDDENDFTSLKGKAKKFNIDIIS